MQKVWPTSLAFLALYPLAAQEPRSSPPTTPPPRFTLAAGAHDLGDLVRMVEQARGKPIEFDRALLEQANDRRVVLQRELQLARQEWEDIATILLHGRGLWLTHDTAGQMSVHTPTSWAAGGGGAPQLRSPQEVLARPYRTEVVTARYPSKGQANVLANSLRPLFMGLTDEAGVSLRADGDDVVCEGITSNVVLALRILTVADGNDVPAQPAPSWPDGTECTWPGGKIELAEFLDLTARTLDANVVRSDAAMPKARLDLGAPGKLAPRAWHATAARLLLDHGVALTIVHGPQRLFEALPLADRGVHLALLWRATVLPPASAADPDLPVQPVITVVPMNLEEMRAAAGKVRARMGRERTLTIGSCPAGLVLAGLSDTVGALVRDLAPPANASDRR